MKTAKLPRPRVGPFGNCRWTISGYQQTAQRAAHYFYYWNGPGSRLYLGTADILTAIDHPTANGRYRTQQAAASALRRFIAATAPPRLTQAAVRKELAKLGLSFRRTAAGDYRIAPAYDTLRQRGVAQKDLARRAEAIAHYTDDLDDALGTGRAMAQRGF